MKKKKPSKPVLARVGPNEQDRSEIERRLENGSLKFDSRGNLSVGDEIRWRAIGDRRGLPDSASKLPGEEFRPPKLATKEFDRTLRPLSGLSIPWVKQHHLPIAKRIRALWRRIPSKLLSLRRWVITKLSPRKRNQFGAKLP
jgi:hypothetical protein